MMSKSWHGDWLRRVETAQQDTLLELLRHAPRSKGEHANTMLSAPPEPKDADDAEARVVTVIRYLAGVDRVGDLLPALETER